MLLHQALQDAIILLSLEDARVDAEIILAHVLNKNRAFLYTWPEYELTPQEYQQFLDLITQRQLGVPIAYLLGYKEFYSLKLRVDPSVLIPRPETELLVEQALTILPETALQIADIGTGSGAIALALAHARSNWTVWASDISLAALKLAKQNAAELHIPNVNFIEGSYCDPLPNHLDAIVSNPPYIDAADPHLTRGDLRFEPITALVAKEQGMAAIKRISVDATRHLKPGGLLMFEHGYQQGLLVQTEMHKLGYKNVETKLDYANLPRITYGFKTV